MDCNLPDSTVHGILQARILEWVAVPSSRGSSWPRYRIWVSCIAGRFFTTEPPGKTFSFTSDTESKSSSVELENLWYFLKPTGGLFKIGRLDIITKYMILDGNWRFKKYKKHFGNMQAIVEIVIRWYWVLDNVLRWDNSYLGYRGFFPLGSSAWSIKKWSAVH